jgi:hypothetical protein
MEPHHWMILLGFLSIEITIIGAVIRFGISNERRFGLMLTRSEHEAICEKRDTRVAEHLARIEEKIDNNERRSSDTRHVIRDTVQALTMKVELLRQQVDNQAHILNSHTDRTRD